MKKKACVQNNGISARNFPLSFRWSVESPSLKPVYVGHLSIDYLTNKITILMYEGWANGETEINVHKFRTSISTHPELEILKIKTYTGTGEILYCHEFKNLKLISCVQDFDYSISAVSSLSFVISFTSDVINIK